MDRSPSNDSQRTFSESSLYHPDSDFQESNNSDRTSDGHEKSGDPQDSLVVKVKKPSDLIRVMAYNHYRMGIGTAMGFIAESRIYRELEGTQVVRSEEFAKYDGALYCGKKDLSRMTFADKLKFALTSEAKGDLWCYQDAKLATIMLKSFQGESEKTRSVYQQIKIRDQGGSAGGAPALYQVWSPHGTGMVSLLSAPQMKYWRTDHQMALDIAVPWKLAWCSIPLELLPEFYKRLAHAFRTSQSVVLPGTNVELDVSKLPRHGPDALFRSVDLMGANSRSFDRVYDIIRRSPCARERGITWNMCRYQPLVGDAELSEPGKEMRIVQLKEGTHTENTVTKTVDITTAFATAREQHHFKSHNVFNPWRMEHYLWMFAKELDHLYCVPASEFKLEWWTSNAIVSIPMAELSEFRVKMGKGDWFAEVYQIISKYPFPQRSMGSMVSPDIAACYNQGRIMSEEDREAEEKAADEYGYRRSGKERRDHQAWWFIERFNQTCAAHGEGIMIPLHTGEFLAGAAVMPYQWSEQDLAIYRANPGKLPLSGHCKDIHLKTPLLLINLCRMHQAAPTKVHPWEPVNVSSFWLDVEPGFPRLNLINCTSRQSYEQPHSVLLIPSEFIRDAEILDALGKCLKNPRVINSMREWRAIAHSEGFNAYDKARLGTVNLRQFLDGEVHEFMIREGEELYNGIFNFYESQLEDNGALVSWYEDGQKFAKTNYLVRFGDVLQACANHWWPQMVARWDTDNVHDSDDSTEEWDEDEDDDD